MSGLGRFLACCLCAISLLYGCAQSGVKPQVANPVIAWPPAPQEAKIRYLFDIRGEDIVGKKAGWFEKLTGFIRGAEPASVRQPYGLACPAEGELYVVDNGYQAIHFFNLNENKYRRFPDRPPKNYANPVNITVGKSGRIFVSDSVSARIHVFSQRDYSYLDSLGANRLQRPTGVVTNPRTGELLVLDTVNSTLVIFDETTLEYKRAVGEPENEANAPLFHYPTNIAAGPDGTILVSDSLNFRVQVLNAELEPLSSFGSPGNTPGSFSRPKGLAIDSDGNIYVVDALFDNVQVFDRDGNLLIAFGGPGHGPGQFWLPNAICIDKTDRIYVSDSYNRRVQVFQYVKQEGLAP